MIPRGKGNFERRIWFITYQLSLQTESLHILYFLLNSEPRLVKELSGKKGVATLENQGNFI